MLSLAQAEPDDAELVARIVRQTSAGVVDFLLAGLCPEVPAEALLASAVMEPGTPISHENVLLVRQGRAPVGLLLAYPAADHALPDIVAKAVPQARLELLSGLLTEAAPATLYVNTLWVAPALRGAGLADDLVACAWLTAENRGLAGLSLHVWSENVRAVRFYQRHGFTVLRHFPVPPRRELAYAGGYALMTCPTRPVREG